LACRNEKKPVNNGLDYFPKGGGGHIMRQGNNSR
jgi:hypothetical protein